MSVHASIFYRNKSTSTRIRRITSNKTNNPIKIFTDENVNYSSPNTNGHSFHDVNEKKDRYDGRILARKLATLTQK